MAEIKVNAKKVGKACKFDYNLGASLKEAIALSSEEVVFDQYIKGATLTVQAVARRVLEAGGDAATAEKEVKSVKLGEIRRRAADPVGAFMKKADKLSDDQRAGLVAKLLGVSEEQAKQILKSQKK